MSFFLQNVSEISTTSSSKEFTASDLNKAFSGCLSDDHPLQFHAPILILVFCKVSSEGELLRSKRQPELSLAASRAVGEAGSGPDVESCPLPYAWLICCTGG